MPVATSIVEDYHLSTSKQETLGSLERWVSARKKAKMYVVNAHIFCEGYLDEHYRKLISQGTLNTCDGVNVQRLVKWTSKKTIDRWPGPDLFKAVVIDEALGPMRHLFIGGTEEISDGLKRELGEEGKYYYSPPFVADPKAFDFDALAKLVHKYEPDFIWIGLGAPKQEVVIHELYQHIDRGVLIGVGAAFAFYSGLPNLKRAPQWVLRLKLEWLFRLLQEPGRIAKRQGRNLKYLFLGYLKYRKRR